MYSYPTTPPQATVSPALTPHTHCTACSAVLVPATCRCESPLATLALFTTPCTAWSAVQLPATPTPGCSCPSRTAWSAVQLPAAHHVSGWVSMHLVTYCKRGGTCTHTQTRTLTHERHRLWPAATILPLSDCCMPQSNASAPCNLNNKHGACPSPAFIAILVPLKNPQ